MKTYEFDFNCDRETAVNSILKNLRKWNFFENPVVYGRASKDKSRIVLYHGVSYRNGFRPVFSAKVIEESAAHTLVKGYWRFSIDAIVFLVCWYLHFVLFMLIPLIFGAKEAVGYVEYIFFTICYAFPLLLCMIGFKVEKKRMNKVLEHIKMHQRIINNK